MTIHHSHIYGGYFSSTLPVRPHLVFTGPGGTRTVDPGPINFSSAGYWSHQQRAPFSIVTTGATTVANGCAGLPAYNIPATSNFFAGFAVMDTTSGSPVCYGKTITCEDAQLAEHGVLPPQQITLPHKGTVRVTATRCMLSTPTIGTNCGGTYCGDHTTPRCQSCGCPSSGVPAAPLPTRIVLVIGLLVLGTVFLLMAARRIGQRRA